MTPQSSIAGLSMHCCKFPTDASSRWHFRVVCLDRTKSGVVEGSRGSHQGNVPKNCGRQPSVEQSQATESPLSMHCIMFGHGLLVEQSTNQGIRYITSCPSGSVPISAEDLGALCGFPLSNGFVNWTCQSAQGDAACLR